MSRSKYCVTVITQTGVETHPFRENAEAANRYFDAQSKLKGIVRVELTEFDRRIGTYCRMIEVADEKQYGGGKKKH